jgi:hypothetical protein
MVVVAPLCRGVSQAAATERRSYSDSQFLRDGLEQVALDDVAHLIFAEIPQLYPAFEADPDFLHVVLETAQGGQSAVVNWLASPQNTGSRGACYPPVGDEAARDQALAQFENLLHLGVADDRLAMLGIEHFGHRRFDLVDQLVNDAVKFYLNGLPLGCIHGHVFDLDVEADHDCVRGAGEQNVRFRNRPDTGVNDFEINFFAFDLVEGTDERFQ